MLRSREGSALAQAAGSDAYHGDLEAWTSLAWLASATTTARFAPNILVLPNRHPAVFAKMVGDGAKPASGLVAGTPTAVAAQLAELVGAGFDLLNFMPVGDPRRPRERLSNQVVSLIRELTGSPR